MSKELEALKKIARLPMKEQYKSDYKGGMTYCTVADNCGKEIKTIENALNEVRFCKHIINKICEYLGLDMKSHRDLIETENEILNTFITYERKLKALEIIVNKEVNVGDFVRCKSVEDYNDYCCYNEKEQLTQEEFDLLQEVLL